MERGRKSAQKLNQVFVLGISDLATPEAERTRKDYSKWRKKPTERRKRRAGLKKSKLLKRNF